ncbi:MAG: glycine--tRNA ligase [bacterium]|nr:glycine--tRNA ligase [bacterium]
MSGDHTLMDKITSLCKRRGFLFPGSEIYGGFAGTYDYGPHGVDLRENIVDAWKRAMYMHENMAMLDSSIFTAPRVWEASGHVSGFNDPLVVCLSCHSKLRADHLLESSDVSADEKMSEAELNELFDAHRRIVACPVCGKKTFGKVVQKNLLATATLGAFEEEDEDVYLRGETAQGIFINFKNVLDAGLYSIPFGIAQVGKAFRNEISPRQFLFRKREFEQMEMQYFVYSEDAARAYEQWRAERMAYYLELGIAQKNLRWKKHEHLVFYARDAWDIEYQYPFGWGELEGVHNRGDYDLTQHQTFSGVDLSVRDDKTGERYVPYVIETSAGLDRTILMVFSEFYDEDEMNGEKRVVLRFPPAIAPVKVAVFPLLRNKPELVEKARKVYADLRRATNHRVRIVFDDNGNIGKRYRRQDEIGTPFCVTVDFQTLDDESVTVRERDTGKQGRVQIGELGAYVREHTA